MPITPASSLVFCRDQWGESGSGFISDAELRSYLWQGEKELAATLGCYERMTSVTTTTNTQEYSSPVNFFETIRITYNGERLKKVDFRQLDKLDDDATSGGVSTGEPEFYYEFGLNKIGLWPVPDASATVAFYGLAEPSEIVSGTSAYSIPPQFTGYLHDYALHRMALKDQDDGRTIMYRDLWNDHKQEAYRLWMKHRMANKLPTVKAEQEYPTNSLGMK